MGENTHCTVTMGGSFDRCLDCNYLGNGCSGPRTNAMTFERWLEFIRALKDMRKVSNQSISDSTGLSKNTVDNVFAGKQKDVSRTTAGLIEDYLIGGGAKWPCAMDLNSEKNILFQDRPETLSALEEKTQTVNRLTGILNGIHDSYNQELEKLRVDTKNKTDFLVAQINQKDHIINSLLSK